MYKQFSDNDEILNVSMSSKARMNSVLVVEDDLLMQELTSVCLEETYKVAVHKASNVSEALSCLQNSQIDFIVCDYQMPGGNGLEFLNYLRENELSIPFVLFTGSLEVEIPIVSPLVEVINDKNLKKLLNVVKREKAVMENKIN